MGNCICYMPMNHIGCVLLMGLSPGHLYVYFLTASPVIVLPTIQTPTGEKPARVISSFPGSHGNWKYKYNL